MATSEMFPGFTIKTAPYKLINGQELLAGMIIPDVLAPGKRPIIARMHGGFLVTGAYDLWFSPWLIEYAKLHSAIIIGINYRLMPEHNGMDMMEDLADFWEWTFSKLQDTIGNKIEVDLERIMIAGDSAGGWLAVQSALTLGSKAKVMIAVYPSIDLKIPWFEQASERSMVGFPMYPADTVDKFVATLKGDEVVSSAVPPSRLELGFSAIQQGNFVKLLGNDPSLFPMERLESVKEIPPMMILHGKDDSAVPYRSSEAFVEKLKELHPDVKVHYNAVPGCEHGLDATATMETPWLKEGIDFITPLWLN